MHDKRCASLRSEPQPSVADYQGDSTMSASRLPAVKANPTRHLLEGIPPSDAKVIFAAAKTRRFPGNAVIANQGDPANYMFLLTKGRARFFFNTHDGRKVLLFWLTPGEVFGGMALLSDPSCYLVSTESLKNSDVLVWDRVTIRGLAAKYPRLLENTLTTASEYLAWYLATHNALISHSPRERLARLLICLAETIGERTLSGFELDVTNEELANATNLTPFTVSRLLSAWQRDHTLEKRRGKIILRSLDRLRLHTD
jgi:CRP/FNR family transcriptional regulator, nitrogen oxide reductase regulator